MKKINIQIDENAVRAEIKPEMEELEMDKLLQLFCDGDLEQTEMVTALVMTSIKAVTHKLPYLVALFQRCRYDIEQNKDRYADVEFSALGQLAMLKWVTGTFPDSKEEADAIAHLQADHEKFEDAKLHDLVKNLAGLKKGGE